MAEVNTTLKIDAQMHWWGATVGVTLPDSPKGYAERRRAWRKRLKPSIKDVVGPLLGLRWWQILRVRIVNWGGVISQHAWEAAMAEDAVEEYDEEYGE